MFFRYRHNFSFIFAMTCVGTRYCKVLSLYLNSVATEYYYESRLIVVIFILRSHQSHCNHQYIATSISHLSSYLFISTPLSLYQPLPNAPPIEISLDPTEQRVPLPISGCTLPCQVVFDLPLTPTRPLFPLMIQCDICYLM